MAITLNVNGVSRSVPAEPDTPLLYVLRNDLELNGAKFGCGLSQCGACTVLVDGKAVRSCVTPVGAVEQERDHHRRGSRHDREAACAAAGIHRRAGGPVRLLHQRHDHVGEGAARPQSAAERAGRASGARGQSLPLRHPQPDHSRGAARRPGQREDLTMNAPAFNRRQFTAGLGAIVVAFSLDPKRAVGQDRGCPAACRPTASSTAGSASMPTARRLFSPARSSSGRASSPRSPRSRPRSSICRLRASG